MRAPTWPLMALASLRNSCISSLSIEPLVSSATTSSMWLERSPGRMALPSRRLGRRKEIVIVACHRGEVAREQHAPRQVRRQQVFNEKRHRAAELAPACIACCAAPARRICHCCDSASRSVAAAVAAAAHPVAVGRCRCRCAVARAHPAWRAGSINPSYGAVAFLVLRWWGAALQRNPVLLIVVNMLIVRFLLRVFLDVGINLFRRHVGEAVHDNGARRRL